MQKNELFYAYNTNLEDNILKVTPMQQPVQLVSNKIHTNTPVNYK